MYVFVVEVFVKVCVVAVIVVIILQVIAVRKFRWQRIQEHFALASKLLNGCATQAEPVPGGSRSKVIMHDA
jgi:hypothetical protein